MPKGTTSNGGKNPKGCFVWKPREGSVSRRERGAALVNAASWDEQDEARELATDLSHLEIPRALGKRVGEARQAGVHGE